MHPMIKSYKQNCKFKDRTLQKLNLISFYNYTRLKNYKNNNATYLRSNPKRSNMNLKK